MIQQAQELAVTTEDMMLPTSNTIQPDNYDEVKSQSCKQCYKDTTKHDNEVSKPPSEPTPIFKTGRVIHGGDWCYLAALLQYTGPNGLYF